MRLGGRIQAAAEVLEDVLERRTPATMALRDWGKSHRFAGSKDRNAIGNIVHDALRQKSSIAFRMDSEMPRALALGAVIFGDLVTLDELLEQTEGDQHFAAVTPNEIAKLKGQINLDEAPDWVRADVPEWIWPAFENNFTEEAITEGQALAARPPLDMRVNTIKAARDDVAKALGFAPTELSPIGLRVPPIEGNGRHPNVQSEPQFMMGELEIQDEGSQLVSLLVAAQPGDSVLDFCAGGGGKSLALAADMKGEGEVHAFDIDKRRLAPTYERAMRAGANNIKVHQPPQDSLSDLIGKMDRVLIDAPCTGVGTWRRKPDTKWRMTEDALERRVKEQKVVLDAAHQYVRPGGLLFYVTCSMLAEENEQQVYQFLERQEGFTLLSAGEVWEDRFGVDKPKPWSEDGLTVTLTPASTHTDGFFFAVMEKSK
ncbi:RsmB/NOP family class I SAM-dependent RNA methyltransferase [Litorimonas sp. RW-G-Af-16]|uniref:RsmB/NOP family class I SAM-dependent RNA methyltransferase n=1 Tax=Litorimonas sp. RW-G-Af-16 TaxID=3241168 RepID=UPI00390CC381